MPSQDRPLVTFITFTVYVPLTMLRDLHFAMAYPKASVVEVSVATTVLFGAMICWVTVALLTGVVVSAMTTYQLPILLSH